MKDEKSFEETVIEMVKNTMLSQIKDCRFIEYHHKNKRYVPDDIVQNAYAEIDWEFVTKEVASQLQDHICRVVVQAMLSEAKTDVKKVLSVQGVREALRMKAYPKIMQALEVAKTTKRDGEVLRKDVRER